MWIPQTKALPFPLLVSWLVTTHTPSNLMTQTWTAFLVTTVSIALKGCSGIVEVSFLLHLLFRRIVELLVFQPSSHLRPLPTLNVGAMPVGKQSPTHPCQEDHCKEIVPSSLMKVMETVTLTWQEAQGWIGGAHQKGFYRCRLLCNGLSRFWLLRGSPDSLVW